MSAALAVIGGGDDQLDKLPDLAIVETHVREAVALGEKEVLSDAARRAEAQSLYKKRRGYVDREKHFARLRILCEAGIALIYCDLPRGERPSLARTDWIIYAAAFERETLRDELESYKPPRPSSGYARFADHLKTKGYGWVPGKKFGRVDPLPWREARLLAKKNGVAVESLPIDKRAYYTRASMAVGAQAARRQGQRDALESLGAVEKQRVIAKEAKERSDSVAKCYGFVCKALDALEVVSSEPASTDERRAIKDISYHLRGAEDSIGAMLGVGKVATR